MITETTSPTYHALHNILDRCRVYISDIKPSQWATANRILTTEETSFPGRFSYDRSPYTREIVDTIHHSHPAKIIAVMKGAQIGFSTSVIEAAIGWIISESPGPTALLTGHSDLSEEALAKIDRMIDNSGIRHLIRPTVNRKRNQKTGDTNSYKEFAGGHLITGSAGNHKLLRQRSFRYIFVDDYEAAKRADKTSGSTRKMIEQRAAAYKSKRKIYYISTPELEQTSNILPVFKLGDQRYYNIPCQCCGAYITIEWSVDIPGTDGKEKAGIYYKLDANNKLIPSSVGYVCQLCGGFFTERHKYNELINGKWVPTAEPFNDDYTSYHISSLYAPTGMYNWAHYVQQYLEACPPGQPPNQAEYQTFVNLALGQCYKQEAAQPKAAQIQKNTRTYTPGTVPENQSIKDGNGPIVLLTLAADLNGIVEDARLDYQLIAWAASGACYSITHGSIGTFIPRENTLTYKEDRQRFTYEHNTHNSVWPLFKQVIEQYYTFDNGKTRMRPQMVGIDCGHYTNYAYSFIDAMPANVVGLKGDKVSKYTKFGVDVPTFKPARERGRLYILEVNRLKDELAAQMQLRWEPGTHPAQPPGFINFPQPNQGQYTYPGFFSHYESEERVLENKEGEAIAAQWKKKSSNAQNHFWDCHIYNLALRYIVSAQVCAELKIKNGTWADFATAVTGKAN